MGNYIPNPFITQTIYDPIRPFATPSHSSQDFCFHRISLLKSHSDSSNWSSCSILPLFSNGSLF